MKRGLILLITLTMICVSNGFAQIPTQICTAFGANDYEGWTGDINPSLQVGGLNGSTDYFMVLESNAVAGNIPVFVSGDQYQGDWSGVAKQGCLELCYDFLFIDDGDPNRVIEFFAPTVIFYTSNNTTPQAVAKSDLKVAEYGGPESGWYHFCLSIPYDVPVSGWWGPALSDWNGFLSAIDHIEFEFESEPPVKVGIDNICLYPGAGSICGMKFNDKNKNSSQETGEEGIENWTIHLKNGTSTIATAVTDASGAYCFESVSPGQYDICEDIIAGWQNTTPLCQSVSVECGEKVTGVDFGNVYIVPPCDTIVGQGFIDKSSCLYNVQIGNVLGTAFTSFTYSIVGGTLEGLTSNNCAFPAPVPSTTTGDVQFDQPCTGNLDLNIYVNPFIDQVPVAVQLILHHADDQTCEINVEFTCDASLRSCCDSVEVEPFLYAELDQSGRTFIVHNTKDPASPITSIDIIPSPEPCYMSGGKLYIDDVQKSWGWPYTRIPISGMPPISADNTVKFNLGIDYTCSWEGTITLLIAHADGDTCYYTYGIWIAEDSPTTIGSVSIADVPLTASVGKLTVKNTLMGRRSVKHVIVSILDSTRMLLAGSGEYWNGTESEKGLEILASFKQGSTEGLFTFVRSIPPGETSGNINLVIGSERENTTPIPIRVTYYDGTGNVISTDTASIQPTILSVRGPAGQDLPADFKILSTYPSPARDMTTVSYYLSEGRPIQIDIINSIGSVLKRLSSGYGDIGLHAIHFDANTIPPGSYFLRISSSSRQQTVPLLIIH